MVTQNSDCSLRISPTLLPGLLDRDETHTPTPKKGKKKKNRLKTDKTTSLFSMEWRTGRKQFPRFEFLQVPSSLGRVLTVSLGGEGQNTHGASISLNSNTPQAKRVIFSLPCSPRSGQVQPSEQRSSL